MLDEIFAEAFVHVRPPFLARLRGYSAHVVCGRRLRPYSRWHAANLDFIESPFLGNNKRGLDMFPELWLSAECCRLRYPDTARLDRPGEFYRLRRKLAQRRFLSDPVREIKAFESYLGDYNAKPQVLSPESAEAVKLPWYFYEVCALLAADPRLTKQEAWDMPIGEGAWWLVGHTTATGHNIDILTPEDHEQLKELGIEV